MKKEDADLLETARSLGYTGSVDSLYALRDWLREYHSIHVEVGAIWDEKTNLVESYFYTITAPIYQYHIQPQCSGNGDSHASMLIQGVCEGLKILQNHEDQKHLQVNDDELVVAYLRGYGDKGKKRKQETYPTSIEEYAYLTGRQGDYIEEGLTDDDIVNLVRNPLPREEQLKLK